MDGLQASVIIVNYNGAAYLPACLQALAEQSVPRHTFEVIIVDNASGDDSVRLIQRDFPWVRLYASRVNLGFAEGNNTAARLAHSQQLILLNNDTIPDPHWLEELFRVWSETSQRRVVSKLIFLKDPHRIQSAGLLLLRDGRGVDYGFRAADQGQFEMQRSVFGGCGAALALPNQEPLFDPAYFAYYEDTQTAWAALQAGTPTIYAPRAVVRHLHGGSESEGSPFLSFHVERNRALTSLRHGDWLLALLAGPTLFLRILRAIVRARRGQAPWPVARAFVRAGFSFLVLAPRMLVQRFFGS